MIFVVERRTLFGGWAKLAAFASKKRAETFARGVDPERPRPGGRRGVVGGNIRIRQVKQIFF